MRRAACFLLQAGLVAGCSSARFGAGETGAPSLILPAHFAEGHTGKDADAGPPTATSTKAPPNQSPDASVPTAKATGTLPDPPPIVTATWWEYSLEYTKGAARVVSVRRIDLAHPTATARHVGRFAFELWVGKELLDRVRFDFPLLALDMPPAGLRHPLQEQPRFAPGATTSTKILVPASDRATYGVLVDRLTGATQKIPWPPEQSGDLAPSPAAK
jgi:hypothetical protein